ncbi:MAG: hypothetical protein AAF609_18690 [Cyanobacteria bacterium P01_C01_bin.120]
MREQLRLAGVTIGAWPISAPSLDVGPTKLLLLLALFSLVRFFGERLLAAGKTKMQVIGALMYKLIRVIYGILESRQTFDPDKLLSCST